MSLLNLTNDGLPNVLAMLHAAVLRAGKPIAREDLLEAVAPASVVDDGGEMAHQTLRTWTELGLFRLDGDAITVDERPSSSKIAGLELMRFTRRIACRRALADENNADLWAVKSARAADLTRSLAWMMAQDVYRASFSEFEAQESQQIADPERLLMRNSTRRNGLQYWAPFLGFSRHAHATIDPTVAVRDALPDILDLDQGMPAADFVEQLAWLLPVLDGGRYQREVLAAVDPNALAPRNPGQLSTALSRALLNLRASGDIVMAQKSDTGSAVMLTGTQGARHDLTFQWISRPAVGKSR